MTLKHSFFSISAQAAQNPTKKTKKMNKNSSFSSTEKKKPKELTLIFSHFSIFHLNLLLQPTKTKQGLKEMFFILQAKILT
jgi:hypothetical protein